MNTIIKISIIAFFVLSIVLLNEVYAQNTQNTQNTQNAQDAQDTNRFEISSELRSHLIKKAIERILYDHNNPENIINNDSHTIPKDSDFWKDISMLIDIVSQHEYTKPANRLNELPFWKEFYNGQDPFIQ